MLVVHDTVRVSSEAFLQILPSFASTLPASMSAQHIAADRPAPTMRYSESVCSFCHLPCVLLCSFPGITFSLCIFCPNLSYCMHVHVHVC